MEAQQFRGHDGVSIAKAAEFAGCLFAVGTEHSPAGETFAQQVAPFRIRDMSNQKNASRWIHGTAKSAGIAA